MGYYTKIHKDEKALKNHIAKIKKRGGKILSKTKVADGTKITYVFDEYMFTGYRAKASKQKGKYGTFYTLKPQKYRETFKKKIILKNPLILTQKEIEQFEGLPLEALLYKWFPDYDVVREAKKNNLQTGEQIDKIITQEAVKKGYDGIVMGNVELVDLRKY
jgi:hypothetical protein